MSETPEHSTEPIAPVATSTATAPPPYVPEPVVIDDKPNRLYQIAAWVAIVAGSLFIVAVIFFSGFALGRHAGGAGHFGGHHRHHSDMSQQAGPGMMHGWPGQMRPGGGMWGPGGGPGMWRPGPDQSQGPGQPPQSPGQQSQTPAPPRP
jgi:hypothetical protein